LCVDELFICSSATHPGKTYHELCLETILISSNILIKFTILILVLIDIKYCIVLRPYDTYFILVIAATLGALAMGMTLAWSAPVELDINDGTYEFYISPDDFSWIGSVVPLGAAVACIPTGFFVDLVGRKNTMLYIAPPFVLGWILIIWPAAVEMLIVGRFITGFCGGLFCVASPMYISELAETKIRGRLTSFYQFFTSTGVLLSYIIGAFASIFWFSISCMLVPIIFAICFFFMPETPQYLLKINRYEEAKNSLQWFRGPDYDTKTELAEMQEVIEASLRNKTSFIQLLYDPLARKGILILFGLMAMQQLSGINAVVFYIASIFEATGSSIEPEISAIIVGVIKVIAMLPTMAVVDLVGRKVCLLISAFGMSIFISILGFYFYFDEQLADQGWLPLTTLILYFILFAVGAGPVVWIIGAEIFAPEVKGPANGIGATSNWSLAFLVTKFYGPVSDAVGKSTTFWFFGICCIFGALHVIFFVPETKGKSTEQILQEMRSK
jgi:sugar porter (SP) family MFS transporter